MEAVVDLGRVAGICFPICGAAGDLGEVALDVDFPFIRGGGNMVDIGLIFNDCQLFQGEFVQIDRGPALVEDVQPFPDYRRSVIKLLSLPQGLQG